MALPVETHARQLAPGGHVAAAAGAVVAVPALVALALAVAVWPVTLALGALVAAILVLAWRAPGWALAAGVLLIGLEGSVKILLSLEPTPLPGGARAVGAAAIDLALFAGVAGVLVADRLRTPRAVWRATSRAERAALFLLAGWLALSVLQIAQGGDLLRGAEGLRLFHSYVLVAAAAAVADAGHRPAVVASVALTVGGLVSAYAALRLAIGPADAELFWATSVDTTVAYGGAVRAVGSFSSAVGLASFLTPVAVFALVTGLLLPRLRVAAWAVAALAVAGVLGSYGRGAVMGIAAGLVFAVVVVSAASDVPRRRKLVVAGAVAVALGTTYAGVLVAGRASAELGDRAKGVLNPFADESVKLRLENWSERLEEVADHPLGRGIGTVGSASAADRSDYETTDNSYLKVLVEQGIAGGAAFLVGLLAAIVLLARRLGRAAGTRRAVGLAALAGFVAFLVLASTGEYVEQPGKVVAWALLGVAVALALLREQPGEGTAR